MLFEDRLHSDDGRFSVFVNCPPSSGPIGCIDGGVIGRGTENEIAKTGVAGVTATINTTNSGSNGITYVRVLRDGGVEVYPQVNYGSNGGFKTFCVSITDNPGGGEHTYQLQIMGGTSAFARAINLLAVKR